MGLGLIALMIAIWGGLVRIGWTLPSFPLLSVSHGILIVNGFLGVLIPLERAVALQRRVMLIVPMFCGLGWVTWFFSPIGGKLLFLLGSVGMIWILGVMFRKEPQLYTATMLAGGVSWLAGNLRWLLGYAVHEVVIFWVVFLVLTIAGERLELNRVLRLTSQEIVYFTAIVGMLGIAAFVSTFQLDWGTRLSGVGYLFLFGWFLRKDIAFRNLRHPQPLTRFISVSLVSGFLWLGIGGLLCLYFGKVVAGHFYDAVYHSLFIGFVGSMIFGHAPIIFPALFGLKVRFLPSLYVPLAILHLSLVIRLVGDLTLWSQLRAWGGLFNVVAALLYMALMVRTFLIKEH